MSQHSKDEQLSYFHIDQPGYAGAEEALGLRRLRHSVQLCVGAGGAQGGDGALVRRRVRERWRRRGGR